MRIRLMPPTQRGFSLLEVMIALVIMSIGMLGIAGLYVNSLQAGRTAMFRHNAIILASDVADRIRANRAAGAAYAEAAGNNNLCHKAVECDEAAMAANDIFLWQEQANATLPDGDVEVEFDDAGPVWNYTINVTWAESTLAEADQELTYSVEIPVNPFQ